MFPLLIKISILRRQITMESTLYILWFILNIFGDTENVDRQRLNFHLNYNFLLLQYVFYMYLLFLFFSSLFIFIDIILYFKYFILRPRSRIMLKYIKQFY